MSPMAQPSIGLGTYMLGQAHETSLNSHNYVMVSSKVVIVKKAILSGH